jgi:hypothetical protein
MYLRATSSCTLLVALLDAVINRLQATNEQNISHPRQYLILVRLLRTLPHVSSITFSFVPSNTFRIVLLRCLFFFREDHTVVTL